MALATAQALGPEFQIIIIAPEGPVHAEARRMGFETIVFRNIFQHLVDIRHFYASSRKVISINTRVVHSVAAVVWERLYWRKSANLQVVHGGVEERLSYGRKKLLRYFGVEQVAVSNYVKDRLIANGSNPNNIRVIENFLTPERANLGLTRAPFHQAGVKRVLVVSRLDPIKRIDLLMDAIDCDPSLRDIEFRILGSGEDEVRLRQRAASNYPNVNFLGFRTTAAEEMAAADMLLHLCSEEPFGLAILEAMAARLPILVPDQGGASYIVIPEISGMHFRSDDARSLASQLHFFKTASADRLNQLAGEAVRRLQTHYSAEHGAEQYRKAIEECWA
jgi:glycosyltransferase involved in cell wall biosynthesis